MQKIKKLFIILFSFILVTLCISSICYAEEEDELELESFEITAPTSGIYGVGTEVEFTMKFNKRIKGTLPKYNIYLGNESIELDEVVLSDFTDTAIYHYTIKSGDNGQFDSLGNFIDGANGWEYELEGEDGNTYTMNIPPSNDEFENIIYAETTIQRADLTNATYEWIGWDEKNHNGLRLKINNANLIEGNSYYIHISHNKNENLNIFDLDNEDVWKLIHEGIVNGIDEILAENGDVYIWICEEDKQYFIPKMLVNGEKIERLEQLPLGTRLIAYFFDDYTSIHCFEVCGNDERKVNVKIGTVSDINILKSIKNGESDCLQKLLTYAKSADSIYTGTIKVGQSEEVISGMDLVDEGYYYVYMELEDEDGKYYPVEDVSLYQALISDSSEIRMLCDYLDSRFKWDLSEEQTDTDTENEPETTDDTIAKKSFPNTGIKTLVIIIAIFGITTVFINRKLKEYKDI